MVAALVYRGVFESSFDAEAVAQAEFVKFMKAEIKFKENGRVFNSWKDPSGGVNGGFKVHFFNITNPTEVNNYFATF